MSILTTAEDVLAAAQKAAGLPAALQAVRSITARARCIGPRGPYETELRSACGGRLMFEQRWPDRPAFRATITGQVGWTRDAATGANASLDQESMVAIRGHDFPMLALDLLAHYTAPILFGQSQFVDWLCYEVGMRDSLGNQCRAYYQADPVRLEGMTVPDLRAPANPPVTITFDAWSQVAGVSLPSHVTVTDITGNFVFDFHTLTLNDVDLAQFTIPDELQASV